MNDNEIQALTEDAGTAQTMSELFPKSIEEYTKDDFRTSKPYEYVYLFRHNEFEQEAIISKMAEQAKRVGFTNFHTMWKKYKKAQPDDCDEAGNNFTNFHLQPLSLRCGKWVCDDSGVRMATQYGISYACPHPIMPVSRMCNIDTGIEKVKVAYRRGRAWRTAIFDRKTLSSANKIIDLSDCGIAVTSENARDLVKYFYEVEQLNPEDLPETECVTRLGWIKRGEETEFAPYADELVFDGEVEYKKKYEAVRMKGDIQKWYDCINKNIRKNNVTARITFASALASVLAKPLGCNCFWVHLWGETESAKTVMTMCAASIWGNPEIGSYITTFNSTYVGMEKSAAFYNSLPYMVDELQIVDNKKDMDNLIYMLTEGCGRTRGNKQGGVDNVAEWKNCTITTGERPINTGKSGGGSVNRVIEIECKNKFFDGENFDTPREVANTVKANYGFLGKLFVSHLIGGGLERAESVFKAYSDDLTQNYNITQKQAQSAALILTADKLITDLCFEDGTELQASDIAEFLKTKDEVSVAPRAYEYVCEFITTNQNKFRIAETSPEVWGEISADGTNAYIIKSKFNQICIDGGYNPQALLSWLADRKLIRRTDKHMTVAKRIGLATVRCVHLTLSTDELEEIDNSDENDDNFIDF